MATFTITLKDVLAITPDIGLNEYPIFDASYRPQLNQKIIDHYIHQEIGQESIELFTFAMRRKMNEIMPLYNQLYQSQLLAIDPLLTFRSSGTGTTAGGVDMTHTGLSSATNTSTSHSESGTVSSTYPQTQIVGTEEYADSGATSTSDSTASGNANTNDTSTEKSNQSGTNTTESSGFTESMSRLLLQYRATFLNLDMDVVGELASCFMLLWDNGDAFSSGSAAYPYTYLGRF